MTRNLPAVPHANLKITHMYLHTLSSRIHHYYAKALFLTFHAKGHLGLIKFNHLIVDAEQYYYYA